jgi:tripeptidyl-peptidase I
LIIFSSFPVAQARSLASTAGGFRKRTAAPSSCVDAITPTCLQDLYSIPTTPANASGNSLYVTGFIGMWASESDLQAFVKEYRPDIPPSVNTSIAATVSLNNGTETLGPEPGLEATLDIQYTVGLATGVPVTFVSIGPGLNQTTSVEFFQGLLDEANYLLSLDAPPAVLSTSYASDEEVSMAFVVHFLKD